MAKEDAERYRKGMEIYHKEELALMCSGNVAVPTPSTPEGDKKPTAADKSATSAAASSPLNVQPSLTLFNAMSINDLVQLLNTFQLHGTGSLDKGDMIKGIISERDAIKKRLTALLQESETLMMKDRLLEQIVSTCLVDSRAISGMQQFANSTFPFQSVNPFGVMAPSLGTQIGNASSSGALLLQQLQRASGEPLAAATLDNGTKNSTSDRRNLAQASIPNPTVNTETAPFKNSSMSVGHEANLSHQVQNTDTAVLNQYINQLATNSTQNSARATNQTSNNLELVELAFSNLTQQAKMGDASLLNQYIASQQLQQPASRGVNAEASPAASNLAENKDSD